MAYNDPKLTVVIDGDASKARAAMNSVYGDANRLSTGMASAFGGAVPVIGSALTAVAGFGVAIAGVGVKLYDITKTAADFGSEIFDASQKTGLGAEALSSLKAAAETSGASLETVTKGIAKFAKQYKGDSQDLQGELGKVFKQINDAKPGFEQLAIAQKNFGKAGAELIPVIRSFDGDMEGLIARMREMGVTIDDEAAAKADAFGDQMDILGMQIAGVGRTIGTAFMPQLTDMAGELSAFLTRNKDGIQEFGSRSATAIENLIRGITRVKDFVVENEKYLRIAAGVLTFGSSELAIGSYQGMYNAAEYLTRPGPAKGREGASRGYAGPDADDVDPERKAAKRKQQANDEARRKAEEFRKELAAQKDVFDLKFSWEQEYLKKKQQATEEAYSHDQSKAKSHLGEMLGFVTKYFDSVRQQAREEFARDSKGLTGTPLEAVKLRRDNAINRADFDQGQAEMRLQRQNKARIKELEEKEKADSLEREQSKNETILRSLDSLHSQGLLRETEYAQAVGVIKLRMLVDEKNATADKQKQQLIEDKIARQKIENADSIREAVKKQADAEREAAAAAWDHAWAMVAQSDALREMSESLAEVDANRAPLIQMGEDIRGITEGAIGTFANGIGSLVNDFVLLGEMGPNAMRKLTAEVLAGIAAQAAVKGAFYLAEGIAALFWNPGAAAGWFAASAIMFGIAGGAALAGRAVAGDTFKNERSSSTSAGSSSSTSQDLDPYRRTSANAYMSGNRYREITMLREAIADLNSNIQSAKPGDVFIRGMKANRGAVLAQATEDARTNAGAGVKFGRALNFK